MNFISLEGKTNFFEKKVGEYKKFGVVEEGSQKKNSMSSVVFSANF